MTWADHEIRRRLQSVAKMADELEARVLRGMRKVREAQAGPKASTFDAMPGGPGTVYDDDGMPVPGVSDPTGEAAVSDHRDQAVVDESEIEALSYSAYADMRLLAQKLDRYDPSHPHDPATKRKMADDLNTLPACAVFARIGVEDVAVHSTDFSTVLPRPLPAPIDVSGPVYDRMHGVVKRLPPTERRLPNDEELRFYVQHGKWPKPRTKGKAA